jgi:hypothetical protein
VRQTIVFQSSVQATQVAQKRLRNSKKSLRRTKQQRFKLQALLEHGLIPARVRRKKTVFPGADPAYITFA